MQSRTKSAIESMCNIGSGFSLSLVLWEIVIEPCFDIDKAFCENVYITIIYTAVSLMRSYAWRRLFNKGEK